MIVMKFGGSSLESAEALASMTAIVSSHVERKPVVVVSAMSKTTDHLVEVTKEAGRGHGYHVWRRIKELQEYHLNEAHRVVKDAASMAWLEASLRRQFRDLHLMLLSIADDGGPVTPAIEDEVLSYGERLSSKVVTATLQSSGLRTVHVDSRQLILTDYQHTQAQPQLWETYARIRRFIPILASDRVVVMGGFIGASPDGATTTLGRGGSDLTATLVGAAISADEVQVWKDVDGMLTCDPKILRGGYRVKSVSYTEAAAMAKAGARLLHPETVTPLIRQRIPIVVRNSRRPNMEGTSIVASAQSGTNPVKCISAKPNLTVLEIRPDAPCETQAITANLASLCARYHVPVEFTAATTDAAYLGVKSSDRLESLAYSQDAGLSGLQARVHSHVALITLVGQGIQNSPDLIARVTAALRNISVVAIPDPESGVKLSLMVPEAAMKQAIELLHRELFASVDAAIFASVEAAPTVSETTGAGVAQPSRNAVSQPRRLALA